MALGSCTQWNPYINYLANPTREQDKLVGQGPVQGFNAKSNMAPTKAPIPSKTSTPPLVPLFTEELFTKFIKIFIETTQA